MTLTEESADLLFPLSHFRRAAGGLPPQFEAIDGAAMPEPYRRLLVHYGDMTSRLETFHRSPIGLQLISRDRAENAYRREVLLIAERLQLPVEYGAIQIELDAFPAEVQAQILAERLPLGGLLNRYGVRYHSEPRAFFKIGPDIELNALFSSAGAREFYGRSNELLADDGRLLARIVEVLRP